MCRHQGSSEQSGSYTTLSSTSCTIFSSFLWLNRTLCGIKHGSTPFLEKNNSAKKEGFAMLLFPLPLVRNKENGNIENRFQCTKHHDIILCRLRGKDCCRIMHCVRDELTRIKNSFAKNIHSEPNHSYPICYY